MYLFIINNFLKASTYPLIVSLLIASTCYFASYLIYCKLIQSTYNDECKYVIFCIVIVDIVYQLLNNKKKNNTILFDKIVSVSKIGNDNLFNISESSELTSLSFEDFKISNGTSDTDSDVDTIDDLFEKN